MTIVNCHNNCPDKFYYIALPTYYPRTTLLVPLYLCLSFSRFHPHLVSLYLLLPSPEQPEP